MGKFKFLIFAEILLFCSLAFAATPSNAPLEIKTQDGTVDTWPYQLRVTNGSLTDNGDGTDSLSAGGGSSSVNWPDIGGDPSTSTSLVNWGDVRYLQTVPIIGASGINWSDIQSQQEFAAGINWTDFFNLPGAAVNWTDYGGEPATGINWTDWNATIANAPASMNWIDTTMMASGLTINGNLGVGGTPTDAFDVTGLTVLQSVGANNALDVLGTSLFQGTSLTDEPTLGAEFLTNSGWTSTNWTGDWSPDGWTHSTAGGNTSPLSFPTAATNSQRYQIQYIVTGTIGNGFTIAFGGSSAGMYSIGTVNWGITATTTGNLVITPGSTFAGTINITIFPITAPSSPLIKINSSNGTDQWEMRASSSASNTYIGYLSGQYNTSGIFNTGFGYQSLYNNTSGSYNAAFGDNALDLNTTGSDNMAIGHSAMAFNTSGTNSSAIGPFALYHQTTGTENIGIGNNAIFTGSSDTFNVGIGDNSLYYLTYYSNNVAIGYNAGRYYGGSTSNHMDNAGGGTFIGYQTEALANSGANETVIGNFTVGHGSNTVTIGNSSTVGNYFTGHFQTNGTAPTLTSCGTNPSIIGNDNAFTITVGTTATGCTATFATAWTNIPSCTVTNQSLSLTNVMTYTVSAAAVTISQTALDGDKINVVCGGYF